MTSILDHSRDCYAVGVEIQRDAPSPIIVDNEDDGDDVTYPSEQPPEPLPQVSSSIAIIRIIAVLGMGLCISFGLFIMLAGTKGVIIGIPIILLAIPFYYGMQLAERWANRGASDAE